MNPRTDHMFIKIPSKQVSNSMALLLCFLLFLFSSATACDRCTHQSKAAYFSKASSLLSGACGYGSLATGFNGGHLAAAIPSLYKDGAGCGACFQIRCKDPKLCSSKGTTVIVTDLNHNNQTDFVLSSRAFRAMANQGKDQEILKLGILDIEYRRVPCDYKNQNLAVRVEESSKKPDYLQVKILYQGGQTEIVGMDIATVITEDSKNPAIFTLPIDNSHHTLKSPMGRVASGLIRPKNITCVGPYDLDMCCLMTIPVTILKVGSSNWAFMSRNYGAVWDSSRVPTGALQFRFVVTAGFDGKWIWAQSVLPADWKTGVIYDSGVQITDIAQEGCSPCDDGPWK